MELIRKQFLCAVDLQSDPKALEKNILWMDAMVNPHSTSSFTKFTAVDAYPFPMDRLISERGYDVEFHPKDAGHAGPCCRKWTGGHLLVIYACTMLVTVGSQVQHTFQAVTRPLFYSSGWKKEPQPFPDGWKHSLLKELNA